jgi:hypothetical protein
MQGTREARGSWGRALGWRALEPAPVEDLLEGSTRGRADGEGTKEGRAEERRKERAARGTRARRRGGGTRDGRGATAGYVIA